MKEIKCYWDTDEFDPSAVEYKSYMRPIRKYVTLEIEDSMTELEIKDLLSRKDLIRETI